MFLLVSVRLVLLRRLEVVNGSINSEESVESVTVQRIRTQRNRSVKNPLPLYAVVKKGKKGTALVDKAILIAPRAQPLVALQNPPCKQALTLRDEANRPIGWQFQKKQTNNLQQPTKHYKKQKPSTINLSQYFTYKFIIILLFL